ncbi:MAG: hypothetical protein J7L44_00880 [Candidatus Diapherotrites archaeon]|nr:hypothetical protein [Candidatus Diapherotrites archaeon]
MMAFTLSKINLLILAVALFAIVVHFAFSFKSTVIAELSKNISEKAMEDISVLINSKALCQELEIKFRRKYTLYDIIDFYYVVETRALKGPEKSHLLLSIIERNDFLRKRDEAPVIASSRRDINANILIFSYDSEIAEPCPADRFVLDVRAAPSPMDMLVVVKETFRGATYLYLIPCSAEVKGMCERNKLRVGCYMYRKRIKDGVCSSTDTKSCLSNCFPIDIKDCLSLKMPSCWGD